MHTWADIAGQTLVPMDEGWVLELEAGGGVEGGWDEATRAEMDRRWGLLKRENPRYHDGELLVVRGIDAGARRVRLARGRFKPMAVQGEGLELGYFGLGVKGLVIGRDARGAEHVLIARRGPETRIYQSMWEVCPAGGVEPGGEPAGEVAGDAVSLATVMAALVSEGREELGVDLSSAGKRVVAVVRDSIAHSCDVIVRVDWAGLVNPRASVCRAGGEGGQWEYIDSAWLSRADAARFDREHGAAVVGPARAVMRWMGWTGE
jgi:8-oxo-dGTP pyrophosphatase MutT (NUDIX family)